MTGFFEFSPVSPVRCFADLFKSGVQGPEIGSGLRNRLNHLLEHDPSRGHGIVGELVLCGFQESAYLIPQFFNLLKFCEISFAAFEELAILA